MYENKYYKRTIGILIFINLILSIIYIRHIYFSAKEKIPPLSERIVQEVKYPLPKNDFVPPKDKAYEADGQPIKGEGPWAQKIMSATSNDGLTFKRTNLVISNQASVPDVVFDKKRGWIMAYYTRWPVGDEKHETAVALSADNGKTWIYKYLNLVGFENGMEPMDPDVTILDNNDFRMYLTYDPLDGKGARIFAAESKDGINFVKLGEAFNVEGEGVQNADPTAIKIGNEWHIFATTSGFQDNKNNGFWHGISKDNGKTFKPKKVVNYGSSIANGIKTFNGYRFYSFNSEGIESLFSVDGESWEKEKGIRLGIDKSSNEKGGPFEPAVTILPDGTYFMAYGVLIP